MGAIGTVGWRALRRGLAAANATRHGRRRDGMEEMGWKAIEGGCDEAPTVIVADDDEALRECFGTVLQGAGFSVLAVADGAAAVEEHRRGGARVRAVVLDAVMPRMDGGAAFRALRAVDARVPVILCSGLPTLDVLRRTGGNRPTALLQKPVSPETLVRTVRQAIADAAAAADPSWLPVRGGRPAEEGCSRSQRTEEEAIR